MAPQMSHCPHVGITGNPSVLLRVLRASSYPPPAGMRANKRARAKSCCPRRTWQEGCGAGARTRRPAVVSGGIDQERNARRHHPLNNRRRRRHPGCTPDRAEPFATPLGILMAVRRIFGVSLPILALWLGFPLCFSVAYPAALADDEERDLAP